MKKYDTTCQECESIVEVNFWRLRTKKNYLFWKICRDAIFFIFVWLLFAYLMIGFLFMTYEAFFIVILATLILQKQLAFFFVYCHKCKNKVMVSRKYFSSPFR